MTSDLTQTSKFLSYLLRHNPAAAGVTLDRSGWTDIETLITAARSHGHVIDRHTLDSIIHAPGKRRFEIRGDQIRAAHGHTLDVDLQLPPAVPPQFLYHGTVRRFLPRIRAEGLKPGKRTHVHLSQDPATAAEVGARRGPPVVLVIDTAALRRQGHLFYQTATGVWLTTHIPPSAILTKELPDKSPSY